MGDIVEICSDNRFLLCGRGDRIVKIGEKRVSLEEMEKTLKSFPAVNSCKIFPITRKHGNYDRTVLACVVETSEAVNSKESKSLVAELKSLLLQYFTQTLVPKYWRFVQKIPLDPQGKTSMEELRKLFNSRTGNV
jgi:acyl-coenzyme A synthetase/AMP-(fatty) acid ligase